MSCENVEPENFINDSDYEIEYLNDFIVPEEHIGILQQMGFQGSSISVLRNVDNLDNADYISYVIEGDVQIRADSLSSYLKQNFEGRSLQYRTNVITSSPQTIKVAAIKLYPTSLVTGLQRAIENYNNLNTGLTFELGVLPYNATASQTKRFNMQPPLGFGYPNIKVLKTSSLGAGGLAGFPFPSGQVYDRIYIDVATANFSTDVIEHVLTHELGHCVGLRHTDWFNRSLSNCSGGGSEAVGPGAVHIPGTPAQTGVDLNSIMKACFNGSESGEFTNFDVTALESLF